MTREALIELAMEARNHSYAPYSGFFVGAALLTSDGKVYQGCNIENASFGATNCAERTALFKAVYDGVRSFTDIAVVGGPEGDLHGYAAPCGICRQALAEFCGPDFLIHLYNGSEYMTYTLDEILPLSFHGSDMK